MNKVQLDIALNGISHIVSASGPHIFQLIAELRVATVDQL